MLPVGKAAEALWPPQRSTSYQAKRGARCAPLSARVGVRRLSQSVSSHRRKGVPVLTSTRFVGLLSLVLASFVACGESPLPTFTPAPATPVPPTATPMPPTPTPVPPTPTFTPSPPTPIEVSGTGPGLLTGHLGIGSFAMALGVSGNDNCIFGSCSGTNFSVVLEDSAGGSELLANEIASRWSGTRRVNVGSGIFDLSPGTVTWEFSAAPSAEWTLSFVAIGQAAEATTPKLEVLADADLRESGTGSGLLTGTLGTGSFAMTLRVSNNDDCSFGSCNATNFVVVMEDSAGGSELLANEISSSWSGTRRVNVGNGIFDLSPGAMTWEIDAAPSAAWTLGIRQLGG